MIRSMLLVLALAGCPKQTPEVAVPVQAPTAAIDVAKSPNDMRAYRALVLGNGLKVLLISDDDADMAAAALNVHVGQFADPADRQGLAHFLEHMLFMGTDKYPDVDDYRKFIQTHAGSSNAGTGQEHTSYHFSIAHGQLEPALDRFSRFFVAPLLDPEYVSRERNAVNSEYRLKIKDDARRIREVRRKTGNQEHPFHKFSVGNLDTLADRDGKPVYEDLKAFYAANYSASRMSLSVIGRESLDDLESMVRARFAEVPSDGKPREWTEQPLFLPEQNGVRIHITPLAEARNIQLQFAMPPELPHWKQRPLEYLTFLLGHEGEGSLAKLLKDKGWAESVYAGTHGTEDTPLVHLEIDLTVEGYKHVDDVVGTALQYTRLVQESDLSARYHQEQEQVAKLGFKFQEESSSVSAVLAATSALQFFPPEHAIDHMATWSTHDPKLIRRFADGLTADNMRLYVVGPDLKTDKVEPLYDTPYGMNKLNAKQVAAWKAQPIDPALSLPTANTFIASAIDIKPVEVSRTAPALVHEQPGVQVWHHQDTEFAVPRAHVSADVFSPLPGSNLKNRVLASLYARMVDESLEAWRYPARSADLSVAVGARHDGMALTVTGFDDKLPALLEEASGKIAAYKPDAESFKVQRDRLVRDLRNQGKDRPIRQGIWAARDVLNVQEFVAEDVADAASKLVFKDVVTYGDSWLKGASLRVLVHGNLTDTEAVAAGKSLSARFVSGKPQPRRKLGARKVPVGKTITMDMGIDHDDSIIVIMHTADESTIEEHARFQLLGQALRTPFFTELRTKQQLGYTVAAFATSIDRLPGVAFAIQSSSAGPKTLDTRIAAFLKDYYVTLEGFTDAQFEALRDGLVDKLEESETRLFARSSRYKKELEVGFESFDKRGQTVAALKSISKEELLAFYKDTLLSDTSARLVVRSAGHAHDDEREAKPECKDVACATAKVPDTVWRAP